VQDKSTAVKTQNPSGFARCRTSLHRTQSLEGFTRCKTCLLVFLVTVWTITAKLSHIGCNDAQNLSLSAKRLQWGFKQVRVPDTQNTRSHRTRNQGTQETKLELPPASLYGKALKGFARCTTHVRQTLQLSSKSYLANLQRDRNSCIVKLVQRLKTDHTVETCELSCTTTESLNYATSGFCFWPVIHQSRLDLRNAQFYHVSNQVI
jgi:hypothetical protein